ncbi:hypothetical protein ACQ4PT_063446 [Festuca glaucescens]
MGDGGRARRRLDWQRGVPDHRGGSGGAAGAGGGVGLRSYKQVAMDALDWKLPEMNGRDGSHVAPSTEMHTTTRDAEPFISNSAQKETATGRACDKQTTVAWQGGRNVSTGPLDGRFLVTYPSGGRQTWVRKQSQKELLDPLGIAVGDGGVPSDMQALDAVDRVQELEEDAVSEEDRDAAVRWVDASDLLLSGDESEESGGCMDKGDYFTVSLSECGDRDNTGAGSDRSPTSLSPTASVSGSSLRPQMEQEAVSLLQRSSSGSLEKDPADHELLGSDGGDGRVEPLVPTVEAQQNVLGQAQEQAMHGMENEATARIKTFCANIIKALAPPLLREVESANRLRAEAEPFTPRRVTRRSSTTTTPAPLADKPVKKASAAETVLLKALGITPADLVVSDEDLLAFKRMFDSPVCCKPQE